MPAFNLCLRDGDSPSARTAVRALTERARVFGAVAMMLCAGLAHGQEALRTAMAADAVAEARIIHPESLPYTVKAGDLRLRLTPSIGVEYNDNVNAVKENAQDDFILRPMLGINLSLPVTQRNLLQLNVNFGYDKYFNHDALSAWRVGSDSALSFDVFVEDFQINFHDRFSYVQDSAQEAAVAGTAKYGELNNTLGLLTTWSLKDVTFNLGYDHQTALSPASEFSSNDRATEMFVGRTGYRFEPTITAGLEGTVALTRYDQAVLNDNNNYSAGVYGDWLPGASLHLSARGGYTIFAFQQTSQSIETKDLNSWYADLTITHALTEAISYSLSAGHEVRLGIQAADAVEDTYVRPSVTWSFIKDWPFTTFLSYENGKQGAGNVTGNLVETYDWLGAGMGLSHAITDRISVNLNYRATLRSSSIESRGYTQNVVTIGLAYHL